MYKHTHTLTHTHTHTHASTQTHKTLRKASKKHASDLAPPRSASARTAARGKPRFFRPCAFPMSNFPTDAARLRPRGQHMRPARPPDAPRGGGGAETPRAPWVCLLAAWVLPRRLPELVRGASPRPGAADAHWMQFGAGAGAHGGRGARGGACAAAGPLLPHFPTCLPVCVCVCVCVEMCA